MSEDKWRSLLNARYDGKRRCFYDLVGEGKYDKVYLVHRLDSATSGVILVCTDAQIHEQLRKAFERGRIRKVYYAIVKGKPERVPLTWTDKLKRSNKDGKLKTESGGHSIAKTMQYFIQSDANQVGLSLMKLLPETGRTHQLRYQCLKRGHPILGDPQYGDFKLNRLFQKYSSFRRMFLHSHEIELRIYIDDQNIEMQVSSELPEAFEEIIKQNMSVQKAMRNIPTTNKEIVKIQRERISKRR